MAAALPAVEPVVAAAEVMIMDPLHDLAGNQLAVDNLALYEPDTNPMVEFETQMSRQLSALNIQLCWWIHSMILLTFSRLWRMLW